jgi:hypothetical protein
MLYRGTFLPAAGRVRPPHEYNNPCLGWEPVSTQAKIEIRQNRVLLCSGHEGYHIFELADVPLLEPTSFGYKLCDLRAGIIKDRPPPTDPFRAKVEEFATSTWLTAARAAVARPLLFPEHRKPDVPISETGRDDGDTPSERAYWLTERHDVLIHGPRSVRLFHAYKDRLFVSVEPDYLAEWYLDKEGDVRKDLPEPPDRQLRTGKLPADFTEKFAAYTSEKRDYLVTPDGKAYMVVPKGKDGLEVSKLWDDPRRRIVGVVQDLANDAVYGWGFLTTSAAPERFYVRMAPKPVAVEYRLTVPL